MNILTLSVRNSGCGYHRVMLPTYLMNNKKGERNRGRITDTLTDGIWDEGWDIVYTNRCWDKDDLIELKKIYGFKLVIDVDDYWILDEHHLMYDDYNFGNFASRVVKHLKAADLVTCTHERLADMVRPYNNNLIVLPNSIPYNAGQFIDTKTESEKVRLFWAGGITHDNDLKLLQRPLKSLNRDVQMVMGGYSDTNPTERYYWNRMLNYFTNDKKLDYKVINGIEVFNYYEMFQECDIMLIPLQKTMFNQFKSNLKILEAAGKKSPVIVSHVHPYIGFPEDLVNYVKKPEDWLKHINYLLDNPDFAKEQGEKLYDYCEKHFNFGEINNTRKEILESLLVR